MGAPGRVLLPVRSSWNIYHNYSLIEFLIFLIPLYQVLTVEPLTRTAIVVVAPVLMPSRSSRYARAASHLSLSFVWAAIASIWFYSGNSSSIVIGWARLFLSFSLPHPSLGTRRICQSIREWFPGLVGLRSEGVKRNDSILILYPGPSVTERGGEIIKKKRHLS